MFPLSPLAPLPAALAALLLALPGQEPELLPDQLPGTPPPTSSWEQLIERERKVGFIPTRTAESALSDLDRPDVSDETRAAALMALCCVRPPRTSERPRLESWAVEGPPAVRIAAILGLGEMGLPDPGLLLGFADDPDSHIAEAALVALLRSDAPAGLRRVEQISRDPDHPHAAAAASLLVFYLDPTTLVREKLDGRTTRAARALLELRFAAARRYGLFDNQIWSVLVLEDLCEDPSFLDRVIYRAAARLQRPGIPDHFVEILTKYGPPAGASGRYESMRGALEVMPSEIEELILHEVWLPPDPAAWRILLEEIDAQRLEGLTDGVLGQAFLRVPELEVYAALLLVRGGVAGGLGRLELALRSGSAAERADVALALGRGGFDDYVEDLELMREDGDAELRGKALVGLFLLGLEEAELELRERFEPRHSFQPTLAEGDPAEDEAAIDALCGLVELPEVRELLLDFFAGLDEPLHTRVATALTVSGRSEARDVVRSALRAGPPSGEEGARRVRALAAEPTLEDLELLRELFPVEDEPEVNAELALALIGARDPRVMRVLETALWQGPWNRSCLAGAVLIDVAGVEVLRLEVLHPPLQASASDRRRVGFALGQFGGLREVDELGSRMGSGDPALQGVLLGALAARTY